MKFLKLALTMAMLLIAAAPYAKAQAIRQSTSDVNKAKTSSPVNSDTTPQYYELRCRGGVTYRTDKTYYGPVAQKLEFSITEGRLTEATNERMMNMSVTFTPGKQAVVTGSNLESGQCSWVDRGVRPDEPFQIRQEIIHFGQPKQAQHDTPVDTTATAAERHPDSINVPDYLKDSNHYWSFFVRNTGQGYFEATSSRYWKPVNIPDVRKAGSSSKASGINQDELNPQPLPPCEKCPEMRKTPTEQKRKPR
jgi:hypothetical protein